MCMVFCTFAAAISVTATAFSIFKEFNIAKISLYSTYGMYSVHIFI